MIQYDSIPHLKQCKLLGKPVFSFYKYDGSNLRFEWQPKRGFCKFGSRTQLIDSKTPIFGQSIEVFQDTMGQDIIDRVKNYYSPKVFKNFERIVVFCEFFGENSFAGTHDENDEKYLKMFDVHLFKKGFIPPQEFIKIFDKFDNAAELIYQGNLNASYIEEVRQNLNGKLDEGVICKGVVDGRVHMTKVKTQDWLDRIKANFVDWEKLV
jgi:hypothetical protein